MLAAQESWIATGRTSSTPSPSSSRHPCSGTSLDGTRCVCSTTPPSSTRILYCNSSVRSTAALLSALFLGCPTAKDSADPLRSARSILPPAPRPHLCILPASCIPPDPCISLAVYLQPLAVDPKPPVLHRPSVFQPTLYLPTSLYSTGTCIHQALRRLRQPWTTSHPAGPPDVHYLPVPCVQPDALPQLSPGYKKHFGFPQATVIHKTAELRHFSESFPIPVGRQALLRRREGTCPLHFSVFLRSL
uniref:Uncharacterized protein LOC109683339 n=1 Tax=Castor canadensis TaxID=51338 RepID=A0A8B7U4Q0_CASCN|nr:uncharacterized protein LOC109683339 [Castor canadensis]